MSIVAVLELTANPHVLQYNLHHEAIEAHMPSIGQQDLSVLEWGKKLAREAGKELTVIVVGEEVEEAHISTLSLVGVTRLVAVNSPYSAIAQPKERVMQLAALIKRYTPDIVLCSEVQSDGVHSFTGGWLAELLQYTHLGGVEKLYLESDFSQVLAQTRYKQGSKGTFRLMLPAVLYVKPCEGVSYIPRFSRVYLLSRKIPREKIALSAAADVDQSTSQTILFERISEVKPRTKVTTPIANPTAAASGAARGNPLAARMKMLMGGARSEKNEQETKEVVTDSAEKAAQLLLKRLEEWRKEK